MCSVAQLCLTVCSPLDCSPPRSSVHGIFQARIPEWVSISSSRGSSRFRDQICSRDQIHISLISCMAGGCFTDGPSGKALNSGLRPQIKRADGATSRCETCIVTRSPRLRDPGSDLMLSSHRLLWRVCRLTHSWPYLLKPEPVQPAAPRSLCFKSSQAGASPHAPCQVSCPWVWDTAWRLGFQERQLSPGQGQVFLSGGWALAQQSHFFQNKGTACLTSNPGFQLRRLKLRKIFFLKSCFQT